MSGPIVRSGASPEFSKNWDSIFGKGKKSSKSSSGSSATAEKKSTKTAKKAKPAPKKKSGKKK